MENMVFTNCTLCFIYTIEIFDEWLIITEEVEDSYKDPFTHWFYPKSELKKILNSISLEEFVGAFNKDPRKVFSILKDNKIHAKYVL